MASTTSNKRKTCAQHEHARAWATLTHSGQDPAGTWCVERLYKLPHNISFHGLYMCSGSWAKQGFNLINKFCYSHKEDIILLSVGDHTVDVAIPSAFGSTI